MDKKKIMEQLANAKNAHMGWRIHAQSVIHGVTVENKVPVMYTDCAFGKWYYSEGSIQLGHLAEYKDIEIPHQRLHDTYQQIHLELFDNDGQPKLLSEGGVLRKFPPENLKKAKLLLKEMMAISDDLLAKIELLAAQVKLH